MRSKKSCVDYRNELVYTPRHDPETLEDDALATLVTDLLSDYSNIWVDVYDVDSWHLGIVDRSKTDVSATTLERLHRENLTVIHAGVKQMEYENGDTLDHAFVEAKRLTDTLQ